MVSRTVFKFETRFAHSVEQGLCSQHATKQEQLLCPEVEGISPPLACREGQRDVDVTVLQLLVVLDGVDSGTDVGGDITFDLDLELQ